MDHLVSRPLPGRPGQRIASPGIGPYYCAAGGTSTVAIAADMLIYLAPAWGS